MGTVVLAGATSGATTLSATDAVTTVITLPASTDTLVGKATTDTLTNKTLTAPVLSGSVTGTYTMAGTPTMGASVLTSGTAQSYPFSVPAAVDFTGIPSWVKRITVMFNGVSVSGTSSILVQLGTSGGVQNTGYVSSGMVTGVTGSGSGSSTAGLILYTDTATFILTGNMTIVNQTSTTWVSNYSLGVTVGATAGGYGGGAKASLGAALDRVRITTVNGTDTFDAGSINIIYE